jgi:hypothetical protein
VEQGGPVQQVALALIQPELAADHLRIRPDPLGVTARDAVVPVE